MTSILYILHALSSTSAVTQVGEHKKDALNMAMLSDFREASSDPAFVPVLHEPILLAPPTHVTNWLCRQRP